MANETVGVLVDVFCSKCDDKKNGPSSLLMAEVFAFTLRRKDFKYDQEKAYVGAKLTDVDIVETSKPTHPGLHHR